MSTRRLGTIARWGACFTLVLGAHAAGAMALLDWHTEIASIASAPAILIDLAPAPATPTSKKTDLPPGPQQPHVQAQPKPEPKSEDKAEPKAEPTPPKPLEKAEVTPEPPKPAEHPVDIKPTPGPDALLTVMPPRRPTERRHHAEPRHRRASLASAPPAVIHRAARSAARAPGAARHDPNAVSNWKSRLLARLERFKPDPGSEQRGVALLAFDMDRRGGVHNVRILRSSGSELLDRATLTLPRRAAPLPPPPADFAGQRIPIAVPIRYNKG
jgi:protein TonB